jgi:hypothetical protein
VSAGRFVVSIGRISVSVLFITPLVSVLFKVESVRVPVGELGLLQEALNNAKTASMRKVFMVSVLVMYSTTSNYLPCHNKEIKTCIFV